jgi:pimeloyl-ACP methyl ester carboxylesterase
LVSRREALKILAEKRLDNTQDWPNRPIDIQFIMDSLEQLEVAHPELRGKIDKTNIGVGGHSFGAVTTQLVAGTKPRQLKGPTKENYSDDRPRAFVAISPNGTGPFFQADAFAAVQRPLLIISGTNDAGRNGEQPSWRREPFDGAGPGDKYLGWVVDAHHSFGGIAGDMGRARQLLDRDAQPSERQVEIVARSVLVFWDAYLKEDQQALAQLRQPELLFPAAELKWEHK